MAAPDTSVDVQSIGGIKKFLRETRIELKKVTWPNRQQLIAYTGVVLFTVAFMSILIWLFDTAFTFAFRVLLRG